MNKSVKLGSDSSYNTIHETFQGAFIIREVLLLQQQQIIVYIAAVSLVVHGGSAYQ